ncbi:MAG: helix-turn-helix domain-containing protein [Proteobacteria bacterium]|nr:helix-turn-helix domain-containing protein [Pseudomonadota bacterium]
MNQAMGKRRPIAEKTVDTVEEALARELGNVEGFEQGRRLRAQIIELGDKMRELRENVLELNQTQAARLIGMDQPELSRIENGIGARGPSYSTITRIIEAYQAYLQRQGLDYYIGLNIQLRRADTDEVQQSFLAGSA